MARRKLKVEHIYNVLKSFEEKNNIQEIANETGVSYATVYRLYQLYKGNETKASKRLKEIIFIWKNFEKSKEAILKNFLETPYWMGVKEIIELSRIILKMQKNKVPITIKNIYDEWKNINQEITYQRVKYALDKIDYIMKAAFFLDDSKILNKIIFNNKETQESKKAQKEQKEIRGKKETQTEEIITISFKTKNFDIQLLKDLEDLLDIEIISFKKER